MPADKRDNMCIKEAVCIHTRKVYDSCKDRDCVEDMRVYLTCRSQEIVDRATSVKPRKVELLWVFIDVEAVTFNRGFYTVDVKYFYRITADAFCGNGRPQEIQGLATFDKRVILFGSEGNTRVFSSTMTGCGVDENVIENSNMPIGVVEVVDPIVLNLKLVETCHCPKSCCCDFNELPAVLCNFFDDELVLADGEKQLLVTLGQFCIVQLERDAQMLIPAYDFCVPEKECVGSSENNPCDLFNRISFPAEEFCPPSREFIPTTLGAGANRTTCTPCR
ncbi:MAG: hypothetical protein LBL09_04075 [Oscillospiraceae bacterium]|jgi:hypothetical protein|nr:hypothetical protein [Oscillospiraceae bacterium]